MSLKIYSDFVVVPSRFSALIKLLLEEGKSAREEILGRLQAREDQAMAASNLLAAVELGVVVTQAKLYDLAPDVRHALGKGRSTSDDLPRLLARTVLAPTVNGRPNGFAQICAWFFLLDQTELQIKKHDLLIRLEQDGLSLDEMQARNAAVWDNVVYWARYLGLIYQYGAAMAESIVPDPTRFLELHLDDLLSAGERVSSDEFVQRLGKVCPVLDGGEVRQFIAERTRRTFKRQVLSDALTIALRRLEKKQLIQLVSVEDAGDFHLLADAKRVTHFGRSR